MILKLMNIFWSVHGIQIYSEDSSEYLTKDVDYTGSNDKHGYSVVFNYPDNIHNIRLTVTSERDQRETLFIAGMNLK